MSKNRHSFLLTFIICLLPFAFCLFSPSLSLISSIASQPVDAAPNQPASLLTVSWEPEILVNGSPCFFRVKSSKPLKSLSGEWQERRVYFDFDETTATWYGFAGLGIDTAAGRHQLSLEAALTSGGRFSSSHSVITGRANYRISALSVPRKFTEPDAETLARIKQEQALKSEAFRRISKDRLWTGRFIPPVQNVMTEGFGSQRTFNGVRQSVHQGLDFRAAAGTPVAAVNNGKIILAHDMFFEGGFIVIDHGQGLLTLYLHLSEFKVNEGELVKKGQIIGLSGATGRVTGPHLHVAFRWQSIYVDPATVLALKIPD